MRRHLVLGTAGHIDHGKTALVRALTGVDTDRLPEEKRRGITIDLGFARLQLDDGVELGIVDVPGHEAFVRNMLAGATGIDLVLFVVAADEGVMPQTREHLAILELLAVRRAVVALTKSDLVDDEWLELVRDEVSELLAPTPLRDSAIVPVSARTGAGVDALTSALAAAAAAVPPRDTDDLFRLPIDRVFTVRGTGTVVTGTVWSGTIARDEQVRIEPAGLTARVRSLQRHGAEADSAAAGERAAIALTGIDRADLSRGDTLIARAQWQPGSILTANIRVVRDASAPLRPRQRVRVHLGTAEVLARVALIDQPIEAGDEALVQLRLEQPLLARARDHIVIRSYSPVHTIAGGVVLEPAAPKRKRLTAELHAALLALADADTAVSALMTIRGPHGVQRRELPVLTGIAPPAVDQLLAASAAVELGELVIDSAFVDRCCRNVREQLHAFHRAQPLEEGMDREALRRAAAPDLLAPIFERAIQLLLHDRTIVSHGSAIALAGHESAPPLLQQATLDRLVATFAAAGLEPPDLQELPPDLAGAADTVALLRFLERQGTLVRLTPTRFADAAAIARAVTDLRSQLVVDQPLGVAEFKSVLNLSRKHLIPLLEYLDRTGVTVRAGEHRRLTPPAPLPAA